MNWKPRGGAQLTRFFSAAVRFVAPITRRRRPARLCEFLRELHVTAVNRYSAHNPSTGSTGTMGISPTVARTLIYSLLFTSSTSTKASHRPNYGPE